MVAGSILLWMENKNALLSHVQGNGYAISGRGLNRLFYSSSFINIKWEEMSFLWPKCSTSCLLVQTLFWRSYSSLRTTEKIKCLFKLLCFYPVKHNPNLWNNDYVFLGKSFFKTDKFTAKETEMVLVSEHLQKALFQPTFGYFT